MRLSLLIALLSATLALAGGARSGGTGLPGASDAEPATVQAGSAAFAPALQPGARPVPPLRGGLLLAHLSPPPAVARQAPGSLTLPAPRCRARSLSASLSARATRAPPAAWS